MNVKAKLRIDSTVKIGVGGWMGGKAIVRTVAQVAVFMELTRLEPPAT